jgi:trehalose 6-phosphate phosphatase
VDPRDVVRDLRAVLPNLLVAVDFDGTLAPLVPDPQQSRPVAGAVDALADLTAAGARVAVITGRDARTVLRLGQLEKVPGLVVAGLYGLENWHDGALETPDTPDAMHAVRQRLPRLLADHDADPRVWIEDKRLSLVVHARRADDPDAALAPLREPIQALADELDVAMHPGRDVLELRLPGYDKAGALCRLAGETPGVLYVGDDVGDLPAFAEIRRLRAAGRTAYSVAVMSTAVDDVVGAADVEVAAPADAVDLLCALTG